MSAALGQWPNAPLAYVLAQVRFEPFLEIEKHIPALQSSLRDQYPRYLRTERVVFQVLPQAGSQLSRIQPVGLLGWEFGSASNHASVIVQQDSLVLQATEYETYASFGQQWRDVMHRVGEHIPSLFTNRIGLRYIDFILPNPGETPEAYMAERLRCDPEPGLPYQAHRGLTAAEYHLEQGLLAVRYSRLAGQPVLPPDLESPGSLALEPSAIMQRAVSADQPTAVLDIDRYMPLSVAYDADVLGNLFAQLHGDIQVAFKAMTTDHARAVWQEEPPL
ncbi:MAG: TIGR04255 family protein [Candidatus Competibacteraceae bacterium]|nr:MAG: TIGR04255 family protein [Candidatus Competibacteraceae bacterium]